MALNEADMLRKPRMLTEAVHRKFTFYLYI